MPRELLDLGAIGANIGKQMMGGQAAYQQAYTKMGQLLAQQGAQQAQANLHNEQALELRRQADARKPESVSRMGANLAGLTDTQGDELHGYFTRGNWGMNPAREDEAQQMTLAPTPKSAPDWATPDVLSRAGQYRAALSAQGALTGKTDFNNLIQGLKGIWDQQQIDQAMAGKISPDAMRGLGVLEAARKGNVYDSHEYGTLDRITGATTFHQPYLDKNAAAISAQRAAAGSSAASAELHRAQAANERANTAGGGKPPPGYRWKADGTMEAIPGGPADQKIQGQFNQDTAALQGSISAFDRLAIAANEALQHPGLKGVTGVQGAFPNVPGSAAADAQAKLNTLKSQVAFGVLQDMRNNSKTGGALGAVSDAEGRRLEANLAALENAQSMDQMRESLKKIVEYAGVAKDRVRDAYNIKHSARAGNGQEQPQAAASVDRMTALRDARAAIASGADRAAVIQRLKQMGINSAGL